MLFPRDTASTTVTVYSYLLVKNQDGEDAGKTYKRTVLPDCVWTQDSEANYKATGILNAENVKLLIPFDSDYFSVQDGSVFVGDGWTVQIGPELVGSYIVKGECLYDFPPYLIEQDEPAEVLYDIPEEEDAGVLQDIDFIRTYVEPFEAQNKYKRPKEIIEHFVGSRNLWYIEVRC